MFKTSLTTWEGVPLRSNPECILHFLDRIFSHTRLRTSGIFYSSVWKIHLVFPMSSNEMAWHCLPMWLQCIMSLMQCLISAYLKLFNSFIDAVYRLLINCHLFTFYISMRVSYASYHFNIYISHRCIFQLPNSPKLMLVVCTFCDSK